MKLTDIEKRMLDGSEGETQAKALDYMIQLGRAFDAEEFEEIIYVHYPAEMAIYAGEVEDLVTYAGTGARVSVPTTSSTLCCDIEQHKKLGCPAELAGEQIRAVDAHRRMGIARTYTCTPYLLGYLPPQGAPIASVESSAIIYFNSVLGARTNRGGLFTRYAAVTGRYPKMGYMLKENRRGTHLVKVDIEEKDFQGSTDYSALGFYAGGIVG
ncbi:aconitase X, partial [Acidobacteriota bacterium]